MTDKDFQDLLSEINAMSNEEYNECHKKALNIKENARMENSIRNNEIIYQISECYEDPKNCKYHDQPNPELNGFCEPVGRCPFGYEELMKECPCHNKLNGGE